MKTIQIILFSLLLSTQSFAWGQAEQKALLGFTAGVVLTHFISQEHSTPQRVQIQEQRYYEPEEEEVEYIDRRYERYSEVHYQRPHHTRLQNHCRSSQVIVVNNYRNNYYY